MTNSSPPMGPTGLPTDVPKFIDVHVHLDKLKTAFPEALETAKACGVDRVITIGTEPADHPVVLEFAKKMFPQVACTLGVHPHEAGLWTEAVNDWIQAQLNDPDPLHSRGIVAVGEIGLDYYYNNSPKEVQLMPFVDKWILRNSLGSP